MRSRSILFSLCVVIVAGCATAPKPQELLNLEQLRADPKTEQLAESQKDLVDQSAAAYKKATKHWEDGELDLAKHWSLMGTIKLRMAQTAADQRAHTQEIAELEKQNQKAVVAAADLKAKTNEANEKLALYKRLATMAKAAQDKDKALSAQKNAAATAEALNKAQLKISAAQLAVKQSETVNARKYASEAHALAVQMLRRAQAAHKAGNAAQAANSASLAKARAEAAYQVAKAKFDGEKATASRRKMNEALQRDAGAISGVTVRLTTVGQTRQLVLPVVNLFKRRKTTPRDDKMSIITAIGALLKKYPKYPVLVRGYTSYKVRSRNRYAVSQARAQQIANHFVSMGLSLKRFAISGHGSEQLIGRRRSSINDRVEIVLLFQ